MPLRREHQLISNPPKAVLCAWLKPQLGETQWTRTERAASELEDWESSGSEVGVLWGGPTSKRSNEFLYQGERVCIKSARLRTKTIMVTNKLTTRVTAFLVVLETAPSFFEVLYLSRKTFRRRSRPMRSRRFKGVAREIHRKNLTDQTRIRRAIRLKSC